MDDYSSSNRSRFLGSSDKKSMISMSMNGLNLDDSVKIPSQLGRFFTDEVYLDDPWHNINTLSSIEQECELNATWRLKERMKTVGVAIVVCLNIGTDPPDIMKPYPCARKECWYDATALPKGKGLDIIGNCLQQQYEKLQSKAKFKQSLDPTPDDLRRVCINLRKVGRNDRLLLHYNGHGVPKPTTKGELWVFGKHYTHYMPISVSELRSWLGDPAIYVLDCSGAGALLPFFIDMPMSPAGSPNRRKGKAADSNNNAGNIILSSSTTDLLRAGIDGPTIVLAACRANEILPMNSAYPADIFTSCLTTPIPMALKWFILQNPLSMADIDPDIAENIPGKDSDRKTPRGELNWIFTAITDSIAWNTLPPAVFQKIFRQDLLVASLFRNFLLAKRIMKSFNCAPQSWPPLPDSSTHPMWQEWDLAADSCICHVHSLKRGSVNEMVTNNNLAAVWTNTFFSEHLTAFEVWLDFGGKVEPPTHLPILLQVLLSQTHRLRALALLRRYLALGPEAVNLSLLVGIFPYILKLLQSQATDIRQVLVCIWASILGFDSSCRQELIRDKSQGYFIQYLLSKDMPAAQRCMAGFVLAEICNNFKDGQQTCLQQGLHRSCTSILTHADVMGCGGLKKWIVLCLFKLCEDFLWAKYICLSESSYTQLYPLLIDPDAVVRASAVLALGEMFGASLLPSSNANVPDKSGGFSGGKSDLDVSIKQHELIETELQLALQILDSCTDGSVLVRREAVVALAKFIFLPTHTGAIIIVEGAFKQYSSKQDSSATEGGARQHPWVLDPDQSKKIVHDVQCYLEAHLHMIKGTLPYNKSESVFSVDSIDVTLPTGDELLDEYHKLEMMANAYVRLWLALLEVQYRDPHAIVSETATTISRRLSGVMDSSPSAVSQYQMNNHDYMSSDHLLLKLPDSITTSSHGYYDSSRHGGSEPGKAHALVPPLSPLGVATQSSSLFRNNSGGRSGVPLPSPLIYNANSSPTDGGLFGLNHHQQQQQQQQQQKQQRDQVGNSNYEGINQIIENILHMENDPSLTSYLYEWAKKLFLLPDPGYDPRQDDLHQEGMNRIYRDNKLAELLSIDRHLNEAFKDIESNDNFMDNRKPLGKDDMSYATSKHSSGGGSLASVGKFEQKSILNIDNSEMTTLLMFHAFQHILAVTDGHKVGIWSLENGAKVMEIDGNKPDNTNTTTTSNISRASFTDQRAAVASAPRVTSMTWINESYNALLMIGNDNGTVKIYRDTANEDNIDIASGPAGNSSSAIMASAFVALPDVTETTRGSGMVMSWTQNNGNLIVGGNSNSIRVWDLAREQCVRAFATGLDTCTTAIASQSVISGSGDASSLLSWTFAGFADGSVGIFDERVSSLGGQVQMARDNSAWIVSAHLRPDVPEVITGSVRGIVKFWDIRTMRTFKTFEVFKSPLTAITVHNCAPIMATGSHAQFIKILTLGGEQIGNIIKYHDGFLGQRIGSVSCLAFHPAKMLLAAGATTDSIVSIYSNDCDNSSKY